MNKCDNTKPGFANPKELLDAVFARPYFHPEGGLPPAIPYYRVDGQGPLVVMVGDNASGKSFARRIVCSLAQRSEIEAIHISMEKRAKSTYMGAAHAFVYGSEEWQSTGENSASTVTVGIRTCQGRESDHIIFWDEPDLGLSDSWAAGMGVALRNFAQMPPEHTKAACIVTHSKALVSQLVELNPTYVFFGDSEPPESLAAWIAQPVVPRDLEQLKNLSHKRFLRIKTILDRVRKT